MKKFFDNLPPDFYLTSLIGARMAGVLAFAGLAYYTMDKSGESSAADMRACRDIGSASALARAADAAARARVKEGASCKAPEAETRNLDEARALLVAHGLDV